MSKGSKDIYELEKLPVYRMLLQIAAPVILSFVVQALYTLVDGIYVSRIDEAAISAVSLAFVVQSIMNDFFMGTAVGVNAVVSKALGEGDRKAARNATLNGMVLEVVFAVAFVLFGIFGVGPYFRWSTVDPKVLQYGIEYLTPCLLTGIVLGLQILYERFLNSTGLTTYVLIGHAVGSIINIILDPILMFGLGPIPAMGIAGAAYATIAGQLVSLLVNIAFNHSKNHLLFYKQKRSLDKRQMLTILAVGIPTSVLGIFTSVGNYIINRIVLNFSTTALAGYGIYLKVQSMLTMPPKGIGVAIVTMYGYFYGKKDIEKMKGTTKWGLIFLVGWGALCTLLLTAFPHAVVSLFETSEELHAIAVSALRIIGITYVFSNPFHLYTGYFQATGRSYLSLAFITARQFLGRIPMAIFLASFGSVNLLWWSYPISEVISDTVLITMFVVSMRRLFARIRAEEAIA